MNTISGSPKLVGSRRIIILLSLALGIAVWITDTLIIYFFDSNETTFLNLLLSPISSSDLYSRFAAFLFIFIAAAVVSLYYERAQTAEVKTKSQVKSDKGREGENAMKRAEDEIRKLSAVAECTADSVIITDVHGVIEYVNPAFEKITGFSRDEAIGRNPNILKSGMHDDEFYRKLWEEILEGRIFRGVFINKKKNGELFYDAHTISPVRDERGVITHYVSTSKDITERVLAEEKLRDMAERDPLTRIYNRRKFFELLAEEMERAKRYGHPLSLIMLDIDNFKRVNDSCGHDGGDYVLKTIVDIIRSIIRKTDIPARYGGEEFTILTPETDLRGAVELADRIRVATENFLFTEFPAGRVTLSAGVAEFRDGDKMDRLIHYADQALYSAKQSGRNQVREHSRADSPHTF